VSSSIEGAMRSGAAAARRIAAERRAEIPATA